MKKFYFGLILSLAAFSIGINGKNSQLVSVYAAPATTPKPPANTTQATPTPKSTPTPQAKSVCPPPLGMVSSGRCELREGATAGSSYNICIHQTEAQFYALWNSCYEYCEKRNKKCQGHLAYGPEYFCHLSKNLGLECEDHNICQCFYDEHWQGGPVSIDVKE